MRDDIQGVTSGILAYLVAYFEHIPKPQFILQADLCPPALVTKSRHIAQYAYDFVPCRRDKNPLIKASFEMSSSEKTTRFAVLLMFALSMILT